MKNTNTYLLLTGLLISLTVPTNSAPNKLAHPKHKTVPSRKSSVSPTVDTWKPDPKLLNNLAEDTTAGRFNLRLPEGYTELPRPSAMNAPNLVNFDTHFYSSSRRSDGTAPTIALIIATAPSDKVQTLTLDDAMKGTLEQKKSQWQNFTQSPAQDGNIGGIAFKRVYFKGLVSGAAGTRMAHGFAYVAIDGNSILNFQAEDVEPYNDETISVAQASILTIHKKR